MIQTTTGEGFIYLDLPLRSAAEVLLAVRLQIRSLACKNRRNTLREVELALKEWVSGGEALPGVPGEPLCQLPPEVPEKVLDLRSKGTGV